MRRRVTSIAVVVALLRRKRGVPLLLASHPLSTRLITDSGSIEGEFNPGLPRRRGYAVQPSLSLRETNSVEFELGDFIHLEKCE